MVVILKPSLYRTSSREHSFRGYIHSLDVRLVMLLSVFFVVTACIGWRLVKLQLQNHTFYTALASGQYDLFKVLFPARGEIFTQNSALAIEKRYESDTLYSVATSRKFWQLYAIPSEIIDPTGAAEQLTTILFDENSVMENYTTEVRATKTPIEVSEDIKKKKQEMRDLFLQRLSKKNDPYEPIQNKTRDELRDQVMALKLPGIYFAPVTFRYYPEGNVFSHVVGFVGNSEEQKMRGLYGVEFSYEDELAGLPGYLKSERDVAGRLITISRSDFRPATNGADIVLTIDYAIQSIACQKLNEGITRTEAIGGSVVIINPSTGSILAMCGSPDYNPNEYNKVADMQQYNNPITVSAYEPGSIFKPITMAAGIDIGKIQPETTYNDPGTVVVAGHSIRNFDGRSHGVQSMIGVLVESLNTGVMFVIDRIGGDIFQEYVENFGFGQLTGIELPTEQAGDIKSLAQSGIIYSYTASFGQGITVTPIQMVSAYGALVNGGVLMKPYLVDRLVKVNGDVEVTTPQEVGQVISKRTSDLISGMMVRVVEEGHAKQAQVPGYHIGGKTGTAQVAEKGDYGDETIHSFVGFGPISQPRFVILVRIDKPKNGTYAETTAVPVFGEIAKFILNYYQVPPER